MTETFWKPEPKAPWRDWRTYSMLGPIASGALGACIFFALGLAFAEIASIRPEVRKPMILVAAFAVAIGSTFGSIGSGIEVFRKSHKSQATAWDWVSLSISIVTTIAGMIIGVATLLGGTTNWSQEAVIWGSAVVCGLAALDASGDMIELGGLFGSHEDRYALWLEEREQWRRENGLAVTANGQALESKLEAVTQWAEDLETRLAENEARWLWPVAQKGDFVRILERLNGEAENLQRDGAILLLADEQLQPPSDATLGRWLAMAKEV